MKNALSGKGGRSSDRSAAGMCGHPKRARVIIAFRNDDLSAISDLAEEEEIFQLFEQAGIPQTLSIIPAIAVPTAFDPAGTGTRVLEKDSPFAAFLREHVSRTGAEIALHGLTHRTNHLSDRLGQNYSEFAQLPLAQQEEMIRFGADLLQVALGERPVTFVPPWNSLDGNTCRAAARAGFIAVSAGPYVPEPGDLVSFGFNVMLHEVEQALRAAKAGQRRVFLNVLFHSRELYGRSENRLILERALSLVAADSECAAMTIAEAGRVFAHELAAVNGAALNVLALREPSGTIRPKAWAYVRGCPGLAQVSGLCRLADQARACYASGEYEACRSLTATIEGKCRRIVFGFRVGVFFAAALAAWLLPRPASSLLFAWDAFLFLGVATPLYLWVRPGNADTRRELIVCLAIGGLGLLGGITLTYACS